MKLTDILLEQQDYNLDKKEAELESSLQGKFRQYNPYVNLRAYAQSRPDDDPLKNKGFGKVTFNFRKDDSIPESDFKAVKEILVQKGYTITQESNTYEVEPGERSNFPHIKFNFDLI